MTLTAGTRLGPYEILSPLGAGGMGEVYRARDARLGREVAIKVLPAALSTDPERLKRFEREARSASSLNHPNIVTIYDIGSEGGVSYIAMELVKGETVRELLVAGPLAARKLLAVATQITDGLAAAHEAGIVHRDLKPENVMVAKDGLVKVLDFGLAKLTQNDSSGDGGAPLPTMTVTRPGFVAGTVGYMSSEQASGEPIDFRSDQFSFGSILYEMATGKSAFQRKTAPETLTAIIREEPEPLQQLAPKAPAPLRWIVERCLAKDPGERYASTRDLARDLRNLRDHASDASVFGGVEVYKPAGIRRPGWVLIAALALIAGFWLCGFLYHRPDSAVQFRRLTYRRGTILGARFAPDGNTIVYGAAWEGGPIELFSTRADSTESRSLGLPPATILSISSTGEMAISLDRHFTRGLEATGTLARVPLGGGTPRPILENVQDADWSPDGTSLALVHRVATRYRLEYPIGHVIYDTPGWVSNVRVSPDGTLIAFIDHPASGDDEGVVKVVDTNGKVRLTGPFANSGLAWSAEGEEVWSTAPLVATSLSGRRRVPWASPEHIGLHDIGRDGRLLFAGESRRREIVGRAAGEPRERNLTWLDWSYPWDMSDDGKTVLFDEQNRQEHGIYVRRLDGSPAVRLGDGRPFALSPDGQWALTRSRSGRLMLTPTGPGEPRAVPVSSLENTVATFFPDGHRILISGNEPGHGNRLFVQDLPDGKPRAITSEGVSIFFHAVSPDGESVAALGPGGLIAIYPVEPGQPRPVPGLTDEDLPARWTSDGRSLYVFRVSAMPGRVDVVDVATGERSLWKEFQPPDPAGVLQVNPFVISPDGASYIYSYRRVLDDLYLGGGIR